MTVKQMWTVAAALAVAGMIGVQAAQAAELFAGDGGPQNLYTVPIAGGAATSTTGVGIPTGGLAHDIASGTLYGIDGKANASSLHSYDRTTGQSTNIGNTTADWLGGAAFDNVTGKLWGGGTVPAFMWASGSVPEAKLHELDPSNAAILSTVDVIGHRIEGLAANGGTVWGISEAAYVYEINTSDGSFSNVIDLVPGEPRGNNSPPSGGATLGGAYQAGFIYATDCCESDTLYRVKVSSGGVSSVSLTGFDNLFGLAPTVPEPASLALLTLGGLLMLRRRR